MRSTRPWRAGAEGFQATSQARRIDYRGQPAVQGHSRRQPPHLYRSGRKARAHFRRRTRARRSLMPASLAALAALLLGAATVFSFAPFGVSFLPALTLAGLSLLLQRPPSAGRAFLVGLGFRIG